MGVRAAVAALAVAALAAGAPGPALAAFPIPQGSSNAPDFTGAPATQRPVFVRRPPRHPHMAPNEKSNLHVDAWQTDTNVLPGPLGRGMSVTSTFRAADCASVTFDSRGRIVTVCVGLQGPTAGTAGLVMMNARTLDELAHYDLPPRQLSPSLNLFQDFAGGGYFYLDDKDRAVIPTTTRHVQVVGEKGAQPGFVLQRDYDLTGVVPQGQKIISAMPDWSGRIWFVSSGGVVGNIAPASGAIHARALHEAIGNSFAVDEKGAVYVVTDAAMYRLRAAADGRPAIVWRRVYPNTGQQKPGQTEHGSGTTPTITPDGYVAITDNADPMDVVVYRRGDGRHVCTQPVFAKGASDTDQSLIAVGRALVVENNFGYTGPAATENGNTTTPGLERVDVDADGSGCHRRWHSNEIAPSVVPKASLANGLVYTYTKPAGSGDDWFLTAIDFRSGKTVFRKHSGEGLGFNNNYAPVTIGPDGTAYVGVLGGLVALRDATPPPRVSQRPRLTLHTRTLNRCSRSETVEAKVFGPDAGRVRLVAFRVRKRVFARDSQAPFVASVRTHDEGGVSAHATMRDGRRVTLVDTRPRAAIGCAHDPSFTG